MAWPDYEREGFEIYDEYTYEVYDPWLAQIRGAFNKREDAEIFKKALERKARKDARKAIKK